MGKTRSNEFWICSKMAHHSSLFPRSSQFFKKAVESTFPPWGSLWISKSQPTCAFTKSNSPGLADPPPPPPSPAILGQTIDRCIKLCRLEIGPDGNKAHAITPVHLSDDEDILMMKILFLRVRKTPKNCKQ